MNEPENIQHSRLHHFLIGVELALDFDLIQRESTASTRSVGLDVGFKWFSLLKLTRCTRTTVHPDGFHLAAVTGLEPRPSAPHGRQQFFREEILERRSYHHDTCADSGDIGLDDVPCGDIPANDYGAQLVRCNPKT